MASEDNCRRLAETISALLAAGLALGPEARHFVDSTYAYPTVETLKHILADESDGERGPLLDLLFFPDEAFQIGLEPFLQTVIFGRADQGAVAERLAQGRPEVRVRVSADRAFSMGMPPEVVDGFVERLRIWRRCSPAVFRATERIGHETIRCRVFVDLRNARFVETPARTALLCRFLERFAAADPDYFDLLRFFLQFLEILGDGVEPYAALMECKRRRLRALEQAKRFEDRLCRGNVETLLAQGGRIPPLSARQAREEAARIDRLALVLFEKTEVYGGIDGAGFTDLTIRCGDPDLDGFLDRC